MRLMHVISDIMNSYCGLRRSLEQRQSTQEPTSARQSSRTRERERPRESNRAAKFDLIFEALKLK